MSDLRIRRTSGPSAPTHTVRVDVDEWDHTYFIGPDDRDFLDIEVPEEGELTIRLSREER